MEREVRGELKKTLTAEQFQRLRQINSQRYCRCQEVFEVFREWDIKPPGRDSKAMKEMNGRLVCASPECRVIEQVTLNRYMQDKVAEVVGRRMTSALVGKQSLLYGGRLNPALPQFYSSPIKRLLDKNSDTTSNPRR